MIGDYRPISLNVIAPDGIMSSSQAVGLGLIVTELVINAVKHAFPASSKAGHVIVSYEVDGTNWKLSVSDDDVGMPDRKAGEKTGLGTSLMKALAQQLEAQVDVASGPKGTTVSVTHATFISRLPTAA
jgi:chemotaxis protein methyltransferase CheR